MLTTKVKASSITNLTDARYFAAWYVEWMGFKLTPGTEGYIDPQAMLAIKEWVDGPKIVGEFELESAEEILASVELLGLDAVQVGMFTSDQALQSLHAQGVPVLKEWVLESPDELGAIASQLSAQGAWVQYFLLDFAKNGISWPQIASAVLPELRELAQDYPLLLSMDFPAEQIEAVLEATQAAGISLRGGEEEKVGYKSFDELDELFEALEDLEE